jgi:isocitrate dehydrogenase
LHRRTALFLGDWKASVRQFDVEGEKAYGGIRKIHWVTVFAAGKANDVDGANIWLHDEILENYVMDIRRIETFEQRS